MTPQNNNDDILSFEIKRQPSKTYRIGEGCINGICDDLEAVKQAIYLILNIERYKFAIYSFNYGIELNDLYGQPKSFVIPELERRIKEALCQDDRIESVDDFNFEINKNEIHTTFTVHSIYGDIEEKKVVAI